MDPFRDESEQSAPGLDIGSLLRAFWRRKMLFLVPFILCLSMAMVAIKTMTPIYASRGQLWIKTDHTRSQLLIDPTSSYASRRDPTREIENELDLILTSPQFLQAVVRELGLDKSVKASLEAAGEGPVDEGRAVHIAESRLRRMIRLESVGNSLFDLEVRDTDPQRAYDLAKYIVSRFVEEYRTARLASRATTREFLESQKTQAEQDLGQAEEELAAFVSTMAATDVVDARINGGNLPLVDEKITRVMARHEGADAVEFNELAGVARRILGTDPPAADYARDGVVKSLQLEMEDLGVDLMATEESDRTYDELEIRLGRLRVQLDNRINELVASRHPEIALMDRNRLAQYYYSYIYRATELAVVRRVQQAAQDYRRIMAQRPLQTARMDELQQAVENARSLVSTLDREIIQQRMSFEAGMSDVGFVLTVRRQPTLRTSPIEPDVMRLAFIAVVLSLGLGTGLVVLAIFLDKSFRTVAQVEAELGIRVIGTLPLVQDDHFDKRRRRRLLRWFLVIVAVLVIAAVGFLYVYPKLSL